MARQEFERRIEARRLEPGDEAALQALRRGWCLGSDEFKQEKLEEMDGQVGQHHFGQMRLEVAQAKAERIIHEELGRLGWQESDLTARRRRDPGKLAIALRLRQETTLSVKQIAARLGLGTAGSASVCLLAASRQTNPGAANQRSLARIFHSRVWNGGEKPRGAPDFAEWFAPGVVYSFADSVLAV